MRKVLLVLGCVALAACQKTESTTSTAGTTTAPQSSTVRLQGAGSTFDTPLFGKIFEALEKSSGIQVNYQSIGSGGGVSQLTKGVVDFGASDFPLNDEQTKAAAATGGAVIHVPVTMGAVSIGYNLPIDGIKLDGQTLSDIYLGKLTKWNDPHIAALNPGVKLPDTAIAVVHRAEGSGTTFMFTSYLSAVNPEWKSKVGAAGSVSWPAGIGAKGSEGVSGQVTNTPGAIGYFELAYAKQNHIKSALLKNANGKFVEPSVKGAAAAGAGAAANMPADLKAVFVDAPGDDSYPIAGFSWIVVFKDQKDATKGDAIVKMLKYVVTDGQQFAEALDYAPLPKEVRDLALKAISTMTVAGKPAQ
ncbi:MAG TPA: phosphate ABC transporter substrate-binding protein PstS [Thermoanaerobaculia bacterium]|jgi:phosphate transport system substrate-binding protein|nr:phosphate ABC transporter substrate-binding protein PstS [Thermoanaerobaculia bacterium]